MKLFDSFSRSDTSVKRRSEEIFAYWNRASCAGSDLVRDLLETWFSHIPESEQNEIRSRFAAGDTSTASAFQELCLHELLFQAGCRITFHPPVSKTNNRPDFGVQEPDGRKFLLEARSSTAVSTGPENSPRRNRIADLLERFRHDGFALGINELTEGAKELAWAPVERHIRAELARVSPESGFTAIATFVSDDGWKLRLTAIPSSHPEDGGGIRYEAWSGTALGPTPAILRALQKKGSKYGEPQEPYIIAVNSFDVMCSYHDFDSALFGDPLRPKITPFWGSPGHPRHTRVSAVLFTANLWPETILMGQVCSCLYLNPWATRPFDGVLNKLETVRWLDGTLQRFAGTSLNEMVGFGIPSTCRSW